MDLTINVSFCWLNLISNSVNFNSKLFSETPQTHGAGLTLASDILSSQKSLLPVIKLQGKESPGLKKELFYSSNSSTAKVLASHSPGTTQLSCSTQCLV